MDEETRGLGRGARDRWDSLQVGPLSQLLTSRRARRCEDRRPPLLVIVYHRSGLRWTSTAAAPMTTRLGFNLAADHPHERAILVPDDVGLLCASGPVRAHRRLAGRLAGPKADGLFRELARRLELAAGRRIGHRLPSSSSAAAIVSLTGNFPRPICAPFSMPLDAAGAPCAP